MAKFSLPGISLEKVAALSRLQRILICVATILILGGSFFYFVYMPKSDTVSELENNSEMLEMKLLRARASAKNITGLEKEYDKAQAKFKVALQLLPDKKEIPSLLENISRSGLDSGLEFLLFQPSNEIAKDFYAEIPVDIRVTGGYHNLAMFFDKVARLPRIVNMLSINIRAPKKVEQGLSASCIATTYRFLEMQDSTPEGAKAKKGKKG